MDVTGAERYHRAQIEIFRYTEADMISALTIPYVEEAVGIVRAARACEMPVSISFTVETDGRLPTGTTLEEAIGAVNSATGHGAAYYKVN